MSTIQDVYSTLQQEGYKPLIGEEGLLTFKYYGQRATFRSRNMGPVTVAELDCPLPRPAPSAEQAQQFALTHPLARLSGQDGQALLTLETMLTTRESSVQLLSLLQLLDQYAADVVFNSGPVTSAAPLQPSREEEVLQHVAAVHPDQSREQPEMKVGDAAAKVAGDGSDAPPAVPSTAGDPVLPPAWAQAQGLMHERFHPLAHALARLGAPAPDEVQMDMMQGQQVKGTAIMMWGKPPGAVVVCEPGQPIPSGYQGSMWLKHLTPEQIAQETLAHLKVARLA
ncbi:hypothetical protein ACFOPQ_08120 [Deinococcus antarcticus]|uniref:Uncharacterized protein n=1 Tax=Deinococcus antarcticus TaxID=1298767 RepID=A0ABV8A8B1_9DEIO